MDENVLMAPALLCLGGGVLWLLYVGAGNTLLHGNGNVGMGPIFILLLVLVVGGVLGYLLVQGQGG